MLAVGVTANAAIYSVLDALLLRTPPISNIRRMVSVYGRGASGPPVLVDYDDLPELRSTASLRDLIGYLPTRNTVAFGSRTEICFGEIGTPNYFSALGVRPILGRTFVPEDRQSGNVVVISASAWREAFGSSPSVLGRMLVISGRPFVIIGVVAPGFDGLNAPTLAPKKFFLPLDAYGVLRRDDAGRPTRPGAMLVRAFLADRYTLNAARAELRTVAAALERTHPSPAVSLVRRFDIAFSDTVWINEQIDKRAIPLATAVVIALGVVQLIVCTNLVLMLLARGEGRAVELSIHAALGATRRRLVWLALTEPLVIVVLAGLLSLPLAFPARLLIESFVQPVVDESPILLHYSVSWRLMGFTGGICFVSMLIIGAMPALRTLARQDIFRTHPRPKRTGRFGSAGWLFGPLIAAQVAGSVCLLSVAGDLGRTALRDAYVDSGMDSSNAAFMLVESGVNGLKGDKWHQFVDAVLLRVRTSPGVLLAGAASPFPGTGPTLVSGEGSAPPANVSIHCTGVTDSTLEALGIRLLTGRRFAAQDISFRRPTALVNRLAISSLGLSVSPAKRLRAGCSVDPTPLEIIGVVENTMPINARNVRTQMFVPLWQARSADQAVWLIARSRGGPGAAIREMARAIRQTDSAVAVSRSGLVDDYLKEQDHAARVGAALLSSSGLAGLVIGALGLYGVIAYETSRRTREFAVRVVLGGKIRTLVATAFAGILAWVIAGWVSGLIVGGYAVFVLSRIVFLPIRVASSDAVATTCAALVSFIACTLAGYLPTRRVSESALMSALREE